MPASGHVGALGGRVSTRRAALAVVLASAALLAHGAAYDFVCDDAFITFRYAHHLAEHRQPVYNLGERVEGYTSPLWMVLLAIGAAAGADLAAFSRALGASWVVLLVAAVWRLGSVWRPGAPRLGWLALGAMAASAPVAAWSMGGLETPMFAALVHIALEAAAQLARRDSAQSARELVCAALPLALALVLATLARPEGMPLAAIALAVTAIVRWRARTGVGPVLVVATVYAALIGAFVAWRWSYYGYPLPNTFYLKTSGDGTQLALRGLRYAALALIELGPPFVVGVFLAALWRTRRGVDEDDRSYRGRLAATWLARLWIAFVVVYVVRVGGDFLDLYRFYVPALPVAILLLVAAAHDALGRWGWLTRAPRVWAIVAVVLLAGFAGQQAVVGRRAMQLEEPSRARVGIEPLGWTRLYALRWAAMGRWIAAMSRPGDWMAVGAAGAMPYHAGISNLDTFGLCDAWVAHHAPVVSDRPGHQRFAPLDYILSRRPVFLLIGNDYATDTQQRTLPRDPIWEARGYVWAEATVDVETFGAPSRYYHYFLLRRDRAEQLRGRALVRTALDGIAGAQRGSSGSIGKTASMRPFRMRISPSTSKATSASGRVARNRSKRAMAASASPREACTSPARYSASGSSGCSASTMLAIRSARSCSPIMRSAWPAPMRAPRWRGATSSARTYAASASFHRCASKWA
ncbi:MAG: hypothetical protein NZ898_11375 [Myxococcota bacterium]|nr:hypothetical protein [Myxococcota bacterium]MDW8362963.1 hypothetical protein [Myxococcales bacterium]